MSAKEKSTNFALGKSKEILNMKRLFPIVVALLLLTVYKSHADSLISASTMPLTPHSILSHLFLIWDFKK